MDYKTLAQRLHDTAQMRTQFPEWLCRELEDAADALLLVANGVVVEVKQAGTDEDGICRVIATTTPDELAKGPSIVYRRARLALQPNA